MKNNLTLLAILLSGTMAFAQTMGTMTDTRDGRIYETVSYANSSDSTFTIWFAENLNFEMEGAYAYDDNPKNAKNFGLLYVWEVAIKACPERWHLSTETEWKALFEQWGGTRKAGIALKSTKGWNNKANGSNSSGFNAVPAGERGYEGSFELKGSDAEFWTATEATPEKVLMHSVYDYGDGIYHGTFKKPAALSCRCVKD